MVCKYDSSFHMEVQQSTETNQVPQEAVQLTFEVCLILDEIDEL